LRGIFRSRQLKIRNRSRNAAISIIERMKVGTSQLFPEQVLEELEFPAGVVEALLVVEARKTS